MDPYLEHPALWPDVHNGLIAALRDELSPAVRPHYYVALEERTYLEEPPELPMALPVRETYLEVRGVADGDVVTVVELLSPANKRPGTGRRLYLDKRATVLATGTSLVEMDLLRAGERMPTIGPSIGGDYRMIVGRGWRRPRAQVITFGVRDPLPPLAVPLRREEDEPSIDLGRVVRALYDRASYDLRIDYRRPPVPPLDGEDIAWAARLVAEAPTA
jgi:hypothetical protein